MGRIGGVQRPGVLRPGPPHQPEHDHRMPYPDPGQILVYQADGLGHSVDEHQIEEELDERRALVLSGGDRPLRHTGIIKRAALRLAPPSAHNRYLRRHERLRPSDGSLQLFSCPFSLQSASIATSPDYPSVMVGLCAPEITARFHRLNRQTTTCREGSSRKPGFRYSGFSETS